MPSQFVGEEVPRFQSGLIQRQGILCCKKKRSPVMFRQALWDERADSSPLAKSEQDFLKPVT